MKRIQHIVILASIFLCGILTPILNGQDDQTCTDISVDKISWYKSSDSIFGVLNDGSIIKIITSNQLKGPIFSYPARESLEIIQQSSLPTEPEKFIEFVFSKIPTKQIKQLGSKIMSILTAQLSDLSKVSDAIMMPINLIFRPIPLIPSTDLVSNFVLSAAIDRHQRESFAYLKAFHLLTNNRYIDKADKILIQSRDDFDNAKGLMGQNMNLQRFKDISLGLMHGIEYLLKPFIQIIQEAENKAAPLLKPIEALGREFRPIPLAPLIPGGGVYNRAVFICNLKQIEGLIGDIKLILDNGLRYVKRDESRFATFEDLASYDIGKKFIKTLHKALFVPNKLLEHLDEIFIDPIAELPWSMKSIMCFLITILSTTQKLLSLITKETVFTVLATTIDAFATLGAANVAAKIITSLINEDFLLEFVSETFYWAWIRYLNRRSKHMLDLIRQARADGITFDKESFRQEVQKILKAQLIVG